MLEKALSRCNRESNLMGLVKTYPQSRSADTVTNDMKSRFLNFRVAEKSSFSTTQKKPKKNCKSVTNFDNKFK